MYNPHLKPGVLEVICGPMKSGKTHELIHRVDKLMFVEEFSFLVVKPSVDTRSEKVQSRFGELSLECVFVEDPREVFAVYSGEQVVVFDEAHFFADSVVAVVEELLSRDVHVIIAGLDLDFRGEPFGAMPALLALADEVHKLVGVCDMAGCSNAASRTQRLVDGAPASYDEPLIVVGDVKEGYQTRCKEHHVVPGRPRSSFSEQRTL